MLGESLTNLSATKITRKLNTVMFCRMSKGIFGNLYKIKEIFKKKIIFPNVKLNLLALQKTKQINKKYNKLKLLGSGDIKEKFDIEVNFVSNSAKAKVEKIGGKVTLLK